MKPLLRHTQINLLALLCGTILLLAAVLFGLLRS